MNYLGASLLYNPNKKKDTEKKMYNKKKGLEREFLMCSFIFLYSWMATRARSNKVSLFLFMIYDIFMDVARKYLLSDNKESPRLFFFWDAFMSTHMNKYEAKGESE